ncbi:MAG: hypothetical protein ACOH10_08740 [Rhodoglobus sp.]
MPGAEDATARDEASVFRAGAVLGWQTTAVFLGGAVAAAVLWPL